MRRPLGDLARLCVRALRIGRPGRAGLVRGLRDVPAALRRRRPVPDWLAAELRVLSRDAA
jgi:hypothetical protein